MLFRLLIISIHYIFWLNLSVRLNIFYKGGAAACPVIPGFPLQAATNEAHLPSRENKVEPHSQSSICCYIAGLGIGAWAMTVDWRRAMWRVMCSSGGVSPAVSTIYNKGEYREHFLLAQKHKLKCNGKWLIKKKERLPKWVPLPHHNFQKPVHLWIYTHRPLK